MRKLSVLMATYNENTVFLTRCVDSVLQQTFQDFEFIITVEPEEKNINLLDGMAVKDERIKIFKNESKLGVAGSRNRAIKESTGKYIALIDSDDYCARNRFEKQINFLEANAEISVAGSNMHLVDEDDNVIGERIYPELYDDIRKAFLFSMAIANPTVLLRRVALVDVGNFNDKLFKAEDFDLWLRFLAHDKKLYNLQDKLVYYRTPKNFNSKRGHIHYKNYYTALRKHSKFIWSFHERSLSLFLFFIVGHTPNFLLDLLINLNVVNRIKKIKLDRKRFVCKQ